MADPRNFDEQAKELQLLALKIVEEAKRGGYSKDRALRILHQAAYHALEAAYNAGADDIKSGRLII